VTDPASDRTLGQWSAPRIPFSIEYRRQLMDELRAAVSKGEAAGGVLFGTRGDASVRISAWRPASALSDGRDLLRLLLSAKQDTSLEELLPVGWFVVHNVGMIALTEPEIEIFDGTFSEPWQVALVLAPLIPGAARAGFFAREADGSLQSQGSYQEFTIQPRVPIPWLQFVPWAVAAALAIVLLVVQTRPRQVPEPAVNPGFSLRIQNGPRFRITWDANAAPIRAATRAEIDIHDGDPPAHFSIGQSQLREGNVVWQPHSSDVEVRMTVHSGAGSVAREFAYLHVTTVNAPAKAVDSLEPEVKRLTQELHQERVITDKLKQTVKILENTIAVDKSRSENR
jgi:hypothetical protein